MRLPWNEDREEEGTAEINKIRKHTVTFDYTHRDSEVYNNPYM